MTGFLFKNKIISAQLGFSLFRRYACDVAKLHLGSHVFLHDQARLRNVLSQYLCFERSVLCGASAPSTTALPVSGREERKPGWITSLRTGWQCRWFRLLHFSFQESISHNLVFLWRFFWSCTQTTPPRGFSRSIFLILRAGNVRQSCGLSLPEDGRSQTSCCSVCLA